MNATDIVLDVSNLQTQLHTAHGMAVPVDRLSFTIGKGQTLALLGESGCGKSMTALSLMRLLPDVGELSAGSIRLAGQDLLSLTEAEMRRIRGRGMAMIFQEPSTSLNPVMTVMQQLAEVLFMHRGLSGRAARVEAQSLLASVGIPDAARRLDEYPFQFSGGMKQRVMVAMALAGQPDLLIADEPTTALDVTIQAQVLQVLRDLQAQRGMAMLLITHDLGVVSEMAHQVGVMYAGELVELASRETFFSAPAHPYSQKLFAALPQQGVQSLATIPGRVPPLTQDFEGCRFADRCEKVMAHCQSEVPKWSKLSAANGEQRWIRCHLYRETDEGVKTAARVEQVKPIGSDDSISKAAFAKPATIEHDTSPLLVVQNLKVHFPIRRGILQRTVGTVRAVDGVSLSLQAGRTLALVGESGCGKTTVGKAILQLQPAKGDVLLNGVKLDSLDKNTLRLHRAGMQMVFQDPFASLNPRLRVQEAIAEGMQSLDIVSTNELRQQRVCELLEQVGLSPEMALRYPHEFSGGQRQRIAIARALAVNPKLIICDEPTSALDVSVQAQILNLLQTLQAERNLGYLFITHNLAVVQHIAHDVAVMYLGRIVEQGPVSQVLSKPRHPYTRALLEAVPKLEQAAPTGTRSALQGDLPSPANPPQGCHFHPRCPIAQARCRREYPPLTILENEQQARSQQVRCFFPLS